MIRKFFLSLLLILAIPLTAQEFKTVEEAEGLQVGTEAPVFKALDADSNEYDLGQALNSGPVVMIFYRGYWCPHCNKHLSLIQDSLDFIHAEGASVIAISPEKPVYLEKIREKTGSEFTLLYDEWYRISDAYDVTFLPSQNKIRKYNTFMGANMTETHSDETNRLPIPATYIIDQNGKIAWRQFDPNYKNRSMVGEILNALSEL
jgi:peroxiredoxin